MIEDIFQIQIYKNKFPRHLNEKEKTKIQELLDDFRPNKHNITSKDNFVLSNHDVFSELNEYLQVHINQYTKNVYGLGLNTKVYITQSWLNLTKPNESHHLHSHPNSFVSGVFYPKTINNDSITFKNPNIANQAWLFKNATNRSTVDIPIEDGVLLLFPSWLEHEVQKNFTKEERISLSFNTFIKGIVGDKTQLAYLEL